MLYMDAFFNFVFFIIPDPVDFSVISLTKKEIFGAIRNNLSDDFQTLYKLIKNKLKDKYKSCYTLSEKDKVAIKVLISTIRKKCQNAKRTHDVFVKYNDKWLATSFCFAEDDERESNDDGRVYIFESCQANGKSLIIFSGFK